MSDFLVSESLKSPMQGTEPPEVTADSKGRCQMKLFIGVHEVRMRKPVGMAIACFDSEALICEKTYWALVRKHADFYDIDFMYGSPNPAPFGDGAKNTHRQMAHGSGASLPP